MQYLLAECGAPLSGRVDRLQQDNSEAGGDAGEFLASPSCKEASGLQLGSSNRLIATKTGIMAVATIATLLVLYVFSTASAAAQQQSTPSGQAEGGVGPGYPGDANVTAWGMALVPLIEASPHFEALASGLGYVVHPYSSFGFTWGATAPQIETVTLFSTNGNGYITTNVYLSNKSIQSMYYVNATNLGSMTNGKSSYNYGGYSAQYCSAEIAGVCYSESYLAEVYGNIQVPNTISTSLGSSKDGSCCSFAEWTGVANESNGNTQTLAQGGIIWYGGYETPPATANSNNITLFFELITSAGGSAYGLSPPSWITGPGQTIKMSTSITGNCAAGNFGGDQWTQEWSIGSNYKTQYIGCVEVGVLNYGWYIFESPVDNVDCTAGYHVGKNYYCQIPKFSENGNAIDFTGNICNLTPTCENININSNPIQAWYIDQTTQNTNTGTIAASGNSWTEGWVSSAQ